MRRRALIFYGAAVFLYGLFIVAVYPSVSRNQLARFKLDQAPEFFQKLFGDFQQILSSADGYLSMQYFSLTWVIIVGACVIALAGSLAKGIEDGTHEELLALPVARETVVGSTWLSLMAAVLMLAAASYAGITLTALVTGVDVSYLKLVVMIVDGIFFFAALGGISLLIASLVSTGGRTYLLCVAFLLTSYLVHILALYWSGIAWLDYLSVFRYYEPPSVLLGGSSIGIAVAVFAGIATVSVAAALQIFRRRDIAF